MKKVLKIAVVALCGLFAFSSCKNLIDEANPSQSVQQIKFDVKMLSDESITSDYILKDNIIHFRDVNSYRKYASDLQTFELKLRKEYPYFKSMGLKTSEIMNTPLLEQ